jgi:hypothetical protein
MQMAAALTLIQVLSMKKKRYADASAASEAY